MALPQSPRVVVTGAASGLGRALCRVLDERGARLVLADVDEVGLEGTKNLLSRAETFLTKCDVRDPAAVEGLAAFAYEKLGAVDLLINNAGVAVAGEVGVVPLEDWKWVMDINLWGVIYGCHSFLPRMKAQRTGHVLNVASAAGLLSGMRMGPYNVTKAGVVALSETLRAELAGSGVSISVLCPTFFQTNIGKSSRGDDSLKALVEKLLAGGKVQADGVARAALDGVDRDVLYIEPHQDGRVMWRMKRLAPELFYKLMPKIMAYQMARHEKSS